jgi:hypothetical protein
MGFTPLMLLAMINAAKTMRTSHVAKGSADLNGFIVASLEVKLNFAKFYF